MMDCPLRWSTELPHRLPAAIGALILVAACIVCAGCTTGPNARLPGARSFNMFVNGDDDGSCCQHGNASACHASWDEAAWRVDRDGGWEDEWHSSEEGDEFAPLPLDAYADGTCGSTCEDGSYRRSRRRWYEPEAGIFNFCMPPAAIGAPAPPPPGRFHPVPTRPVFAPRPSLALVTPTAE